MSDVHIDHLQIEQLVQGNGNIIGCNICGPIHVNSETSTHTQIQNFDPKIISDLLNALNGMQVAAQSLSPGYQEQANAQINEIEKELHKEKPSFGRLRAAYDVLRRLVTSEGFHRAVEVFGALLIK